MGGKVLWGHPDGYFLNAQGQKLAHSFGPGMQVSKPNMHAAYPTMRCFGNKNCHILMALAFYGERPTYSVPLQGKGGERGSYVGICHHLIPNKLDYRPANLLCWLTREQHCEADRRQRALRKVVPDLYEIGYDRLRQIQDPRVTCREVFDVELEKIINHKP